VSVAVTCQFAPGDKKVGVFVVGSATSWLQHDYNTTDYYIIPSWCDRVPASSGVHCKPSIELRWELNLKLLDKFFFHGEQPPKDFSIYMHLLFTALQR